MHTYNFQMLLLALVPCPRGRGEARQRLLSRTNCGAGAEPCLHAQEGGGEAFPKVPRNSATCAQGSLLHRTICSSELN